MSDEQEVLKALLKYGCLDNEEQKVKGIAQLAVDQGYEHLSPLQRNVVVPFLTRNCEGVTNPGGHHNDCHVVLEGEALVAALDYHDGVLCEDCINENEQYAREWERIQAE